MLKVEITKIRAHVGVEIVRTGSVLAGTVRATVPKIVTEYQIESPAEESKVAALLRAARNGCFVRAALAEPVAMEDTTTLNGKPIKF